MGRIVIETALQNLVANGWMQRRRLRQVYCLVAIIVYLAMDQPQPSRRKNEDTLDGAKSKCLPSFRQRLEASRARTSASCGHPLIAYSMRPLQAETVTHVIVTTKTRKLEMPAAMGPVSFLRPAELA